MFRIPPRQTEIRSLLSTEVLYIGLGDQFDDDRRVVRVAASTSLLSRTDRRDTNVQNHHADPWRMAERP